MAAQGFGATRPAGRIDLGHARRALRRVGLVQIDSVNVLVRSHELPLFSRLGAYPRGAVDALAERHREFFEYWAHEASFVPIALHPLLRWRMGRAGTEAWGSIVRLRTEMPGYLDAVLQEVADRGPLAVSGLSDAGSRPGVGMWNWSIGKTALEALFWFGELSAVGRSRTFERIYDLTERVIPSEVLAQPTPAEADAQRALLAHSARWLGVGTAKDLADYFRIRTPVARPLLEDLVEEGVLWPVTVEGWKDRAYLDPNATVPRRIAARALLSPFDSLIWERTRTERIFGMRVRLEIYTPAARREHGYYVLPYLLGDQLVARVDLKADRANRALRVQAAFIEPAHASRAAEVAAELRTELDLMARWLGLERVEHAGGGNLRVGGRNQPG